MNAFGRRLRLSIFGESHGEGVGIVLDGVPPGLAIDASAIQDALDARRPGAGKLVSQRKERDIARILSGTFRGKATGAPLCIWIGNEDKRSQDYAQQPRLPRPGHADLTNHLWARGHEDPRGGGHSSGRLTAPLVAAGALAQGILDAHKVRCAAHLHAAGTVEGVAGTVPVTTMLKRVARSRVKTGHIDLEDRLADEIEAARKAGDSVGGVIEFRAEGVAAAWGDPLMDSVESQLAHLLFAIPAVKGVSFGAGFAGARMRGSRHNDPYQPGKEGHPEPATNHAGGILGGRTTGAPVWGLVAVKPASSIFLPQATVDLDSGEAASLELKGRHDPCIAIRAVPVVQAALRLVLADFALQARQEGHA